MLGDYAAFPPDIRTVVKEIPDGTPLEQTSGMARTSWVKKPGHTDKRKCPYEQDEDSQYCPGCDDKVHEGASVSFTGYFIWIIFGSWTNAWHSSKYCARSQRGAFGGFLRRTWPKISFQQLVQKRTSWSAPMQTRIIVEAALARITGFDAGL
ncbi:hypothetical protein EI94DRAFT_1094803 [Lactarius quietus]|nr:hypothetical protein EI94DRAFT_1094803 [Lactarius quietus]